MTDQSRQAAIRAVRTLPEICALAKARRYSVSWVINVCKHRKASWPPSEIFRAYERSGV